MSYVYIRSEPSLWTVGFYDPKGNWHSDSDYSDSEKAAQRVAWLNGQATDNISLSGATVERGTPEWDAAWDDLRHIIIADDLGDGRDLVQLHDGEGWQYMGTYEGKHEFRHRCHPVTNCREYRLVSA